MSANVSILGNLGRAPEKQRTPDGTLITTFSIASNTTRNTPQGSEKQTNWFRVRAFGKQAETIAKHAKRGDRMLVQGKLNLGAWTDREGAPQVNADLTLQDFQFVGSGANADGGGGSANGEMNANAPAKEYSVETEISGDGTGVQEITTQTAAY